MRVVFVSAIAAAAITVVSAHEHHTDRIPEGEAISPDPIDGILWAHIFIMTLAFGILFPTGMVLGLTRSRFHVPVQVSGLCLTVVGYFLAHHHKGRQFGPTAHAKFAKVVFGIMLLQAVVGVYLKLHMTSGIHARLRKFCVIAHGVAGKAFILLSWTQMLLGAIAGLGFCNGDHLGQCLAHEIMGSSFIAYGIVMLILLHFGRDFLRRINKSQEFLDSAVIGAWGLFNTFTEHHGGAWSHKDLQHTALGVVWFCAGVLGVALSTQNGKPRRNVVPGVVIILTGIAMASHQQSLPLSTTVHATFGYTLVAAGLARIIEISIVLKDADYLAEQNSFQYLSPYLLVASGMHFMGATEEQMVFLDTVGIDPHSYSLILYLANLTVAQGLILLYKNSGNKADSVDTAADYENLQVQGQANGDEDGQFYRNGESLELNTLLQSDDEDEQVSKEGHSHN